MGNRANLIIVENGQYELYYTHWGANTLPEDLFWGPSEAIAYIREQQKMGDNGWLDEIWAEGGAVVDLDRKVLLLFGGENIDVIIPLRRVYLQLLAKTWPGWDVRWAYQGIADLADYVGYPRENVIVPLDETELMDQLYVTDVEWCDVIGSFRLVDGEIIIYPLNGFFEHYLPIGPKLIEFIDKTKGFPILDLQNLEWDNFPMSGFHIDIAKQTLDFWSYEPGADFVRKLQPKWNGWKIQWHQDRYEVQAELTEGKIIFPNIEEDVLISHLRKIFGAESPNPVQNMMNLLNQHEKEGKKAEINPFIFSHVPSQVEKRSRVEIFERAVQEWNRDRQR